MRPGLSNAGGPVIAGDFGFMTLIQSGERAAVVAAVGALGDQPLKTHQAGISE